MSFERAIRTEKVGKCYPIFGRPEDRLKQMFVRGRRKYYRDFWAVRDVDFEVYRGETVGIVGRNGSGKSTLLQLICGTLTPTTGCLAVNGRVAALLELGAGFNPEFTGHENVLMNAAVLGLSTKEIEERLPSIIEFADIGEFIDQQVKTYSSGMYVRLAFAVAAHVDADILVIDEALSVGDAVFQQRCMRYLRHFMKTGTVLFVSHDLGAVKSLCNRAIWLEHGGIRMAGEAKDVCDAYLAACVEEQQGESKMHRESGSRSLGPREPRAIHDQRLKFINGSTARNDIEVFQFDPDAASFGKGGATIIDVRLLDDQDRMLSWIVGGEVVVLSIHARANATLKNPILGFYIKDRLGQYLFGDNTYLTYKDVVMHTSPGTQLEARFKFQMPLLSPGKYAISVAVAEGIQEDHVQHHWIHEAIFFESQVSPLHCGGLVGIPMLDISVALSTEKSADVISTGAV